MWVYASMFYKSAFLKKNYENPLTVYNKFNY